MLLMAKKQKGNFHYVDVCFGDLVDEEEGCSLFTMVWQRVQFHLLPTMVMGLPKEAFKTACKIITVPLNKTGF